MVSAQDKQKKDEKTTPAADASVGEILRRARVQHEMSLEQVEGFLRIRASQLDAIERMDFTALPAWVYVVGFVKNYAEFLGLDGEKTVALLKKQVAQPKKTAELAFPVAATDSPMPNIRIFLTALVAVVCAVVYFTFIAAPDRAIVEDIPPVPIEEDVAAPGLSIERKEPAEAAYAPDMQAQMTQAVEQAQAGDEAVPAMGPTPIPGQAPPAAATAPAAPQPPAQPAVPQHRIIIRVTEKSWVEIRNQEGQRVVSRILNPGDAYYVPNDKTGMTMTTGNAGGLEVFIDGAAGKALGKAGDIRRNIPLEPDGLKQILGQ